MRSVVRFCCLLTGMVACAVGVAPLAAQPPAAVAPPPRAKRLTDAEVAGLIARVGSPRFAEREAATQALARAPEAKDAMTRALAAATNPEVARRLNWALEVQQRDWANARLAKLPEYVQRKQFDRLVETMVACREHLTEDHDKHVRAFVRDVCVAALPDSGGRWNGGQWWDVFKTLAWSHRANQQREVLGPNIVAREAIPLTGTGTAVIASDRLAPGLIDDFRMTRLFGCVALCNGEVEVDGIEGGFVLATGSVRVRGMCGAVVVSLTEVEVYSADLSISLIVSRGPAPQMDDPRSVVRAHDFAFFRGWEMFSPRDCGGHLRSLFGAVWADPVAPDSPFARAGVRAGDRIDRIDGTPVHTARDAYRLLCRAAVTSGDATVVTVSAGRRRESVLQLQPW